MYFILLVSDGAESIALAELVIVSQCPACAAILGQNSLHRVEELSFVLNAPGQALTRCQG